MLQLQKVFSLEEDVLPLLPNYSPFERTSEDGEAQEPVTKRVSDSSLSGLETSSSSGGNGLPPPIHREPHRLQAWRKGSEAYRRNLKIIGQEKSDVILYSYDGYLEEAADFEKRTFIEMMELKTRKRTVLYTHNTIINVVHASVNQDRNLLVFTIFARYKSDDHDHASDEFEDIYETCMVEILPQNRVFSLGNPSRKFQRVQFLDCNLHGNTRKQKAVYYLLFILHKEYVHAYSLPMGYLKGFPSAGSWRIVEQPRKEYSVAKRFLWYQWDLNGQILHYVYFKPNPKEQTSRIEYMLRSVNFGEDGKPEILLDVPINIRLKRNPAEESEYIHLPCARSIPDVNFHMEVVRIDQHAVCACFQSIDDQARGIVVTVIILSNRSIRKEFAIPMNNLPVEVVLATRVYFTAMDGMLVMYIPSRYLQFVDCCSEHDPCPSLYLPEMSPTMPNVDSDTYPSAFITNFEIFSNDSHPFGYAMYDCQNDIAYRYSIDEETMMKVFEKNVTDAHIQAVHMAICHLQDEGMGRRLVKQLCEKYSQYATAEVFKEILLGATYQAMKALKCDPNILKCLPITSILSYTDLVGEENRLKLGRSPSFVDELWRSADTSKKGPITRFNFEVPLGVSIAQAAVTSTIQVRRKFDVFFERFFGPVGPEAVPIKKASTEEEDEGAFQKMKFTEVLAEYISTSFPKETKAKCAEWADKYTQKLSYQSTTLWISIDDARRFSITAELKENKSFSRDSAFLNLFHLLENFYCALEELSFPFPSGFHTKFAVLGFHCLPRHVFLQYLDRGVFQMTTNFMSHIELVLGQSKDPEDCQLKFFMASKMRKRDKALKLLRKFPENGPLVVENFVGALLSEVNDDKLEGDEEEASAAAATSDGEEEKGEEGAEIIATTFMPLTYFTQYLKSKGLPKADENFLKMIYSDHFKDV